MYYPYPANDGKHKYYIITDIGKKLLFGAYGYSDYTIHKDEKRKLRYISRHKNNENWGKSGINTAGSAHRCPRSGLDAGGRGLPRLLTASLAAVSTPAAEDCRGRSPLSSQRSQRRRSRTAMVSRRHDIKFFSASRTAKTAPKGNSLKETCCRWLAATIMRAAFRRHTCSSGFAISGAQQVTRGPLRGALRTFCRRTATRRSAAPPSQRSRRRRPRIAAAAHRGPRSVLVAGGQGMVRLPAAAPAAVSTPQSSPDRLCGRRLL